MKGHEGGEKVRGVVPTLLRTPLAQDSHSILFWLLFNTVFVLFLIVNMVSSS